MKRCKECKEPWRDCECPYPTESEDIEEEEQQREEASKRNKNFLGVDFPYVAGDPFW